jgi:hypothetical protein
MSEKQKKFVQVFAVALFLLPTLAMADAWDQALLDWGSKIRIALYALAGTLGLISIVWSGIKWLFARAAGDHSHSFFEYLQQVGVVLVIGGSIAIGTAAWQVFGSGSVT